MALFTTTAFPLNALVANIELGKIGLPELQRPFVWPNTNVRNLFDSLYRGYPAGYLLLWETGANGGLKGIGAGNEEAAPSLAVVDGQQRLTSLYAVVKGVEVLRANFKKERIRIAFNPLLEQFEVSDAAIAKDRAFIPDISVLWTPETRLIPFALSYIQKLREVRDISDEQADRAMSAISELHNLLNYSFTALTLEATVDVETVAEVFVRINGQGKKLNNADFIMTLMSVFWDEGRAELERFAREATLPSEKPSAYNHLIKPSPDQLLRVTIGLGLKRARLENVYAVLRGRDALTGKDDPARREAQFALLKTAQAHSLNLANWHHYLSALKLAGYCNGSMITSEMAVIYGYVLYLIGVVDHGVDRAAMRQVIAEFLFMALLTRRYTTSAESAFDFDLAQLRDVQSGAEYVVKLRTICGTALTPDYWSITLPNNLATSAAVSPSRSAYQAALVKLGARALYSAMPLAEMADPTVKGSKSMFEQHHLFPRGYLATLGITDRRQVNQIANFTAVEWPDNLKIGAKPPSEYVLALESAMSPGERKQMSFWHALPQGWWTMDYEDFLRERRVRMAEVIRTAYHRLTGTEEPAAPVQLSVADLIAGGESDAVEFKSTLRTNLHTGQPDEKIQLSALKTVAGFLNAKGGTLIIGVADDAQIVGLEADGFMNEDKMSLHLVNLVRDRIGDLFLPYVHPHFEDQENGRVLIVRCEAGPKPAFVKDGSTQRFFVRGANSTAELSGNSVTDYVKAHFK